MTEHPRAPAIVDTARRQFCSVCKDHLEMSVVSDTNEDGVIWLKCPRCEGILPHMEDAEAPATESAASTTLDDIDIEKAQPYDPTQVYEVGDVLHHRGWDDYGVVTEKGELPGKRRVVKVRWVEHGEVQLIEGAG